MKTNATFEEESELYKKGQLLISTAHEYLMEMCKIPSMRWPSAFWLDDTEGRLIVFTRGENAAALKQACCYINENDDRPNVLFPEGFVGTHNKLSKSTTKELVEELCKREGVTEIIVTLEDYAYISHGKKPSLKVDGAARILVVID